MREARIRLSESTSPSELTRLIAQAPDARRIVLEVEANDRVRAIERVRDFLLSNISRTIFVYAREPGEGE